MEAQPTSVREVLRRVRRQIDAILPPGWSAELEAGVGSPAPDAVLALRGPRGQSATFAIEAKQSLDGRNLPGALSQIRTYVSAIRDTQPMVVARYLSPPVRDTLTAQRVSYADATGNIRIASAKPALFLRDVGAASDPWRGRGRPRGSLRGGPAAWIVRALVDYLPPYTVPRLASAAETSVAAAYRVVDYLAEETLLERRPRGPIVDVQWRAVLTRWSSDYEYQATNRATSYLSARGIDAALARLASANTRCAVTGSFAAQAYAPYAPPRTLTLYADDRDSLAAELDLRPLESGANVLIAEPRYDVVYERSESFAGVTITSASQTAVDLMTGPGRGPAEADALLDWMSSHEPTWRKPLP
ncbi:MAG: type IV toxin-antitoxin system AbiEi family antitoxin [Mycobacteriales bacterium]